MKQLDDILSRLNDMATRDSTMGWDDIEDLCKVRELLARAIGAKYWQVTERFERLKRGNNAR